MPSRLACNLYKSTADMDSAVLFNFSDSVKSLSRTVGYTQEYFIRSFLQEVGVTPYQYILSKRMNEAILLMRQGLTMDEVAARIGYASGKSFSAAFKRRFGIAPDQYRKIFLTRA